jgi:hypothetical protein
MEELVGMDYETAVVLLKDENWRVVVRDGKGYVITCDFKPERLNLEIENNIITKVYGG